MIHILFVMVFMDWYGCIRKTQKIQHVFMRLCHNTINDNQNKIKAGVKMKILYEFRDGNLYVLSLEKKIEIDGSQVCSVIDSVQYNKRRDLEGIYPEDTDLKSIKYENFNKHYSYSRTRSEEKEYTDGSKEDKLLCLKLGHYLDKDKKRDQQYNIIVEAESFYEKLEMGKKPYIVIDSISDYIEWIHIYQTVSMFVTCENVLNQYIEKMYFITTDKKSIDAMNLNKLCDLAKNSKKKILKEMISATREASDKRKKINKDKQFLIDKFDNELKNEEGDENNCIIATATHKPLERIKGEALNAIRQIIKRYNREEYSMYYRGVGHIIYPDMPGVFRGNRKYEEDRMYKAMMIAFPKEFSGLRYLDRLAKLQHFELSTRLLDVSSNPLVALYMACNKIYTGDEEQIDWGEVLLYFMAGEKERAYDSKSILINAALVKVPYEEKTVMYQFIYIHKAYYILHFDGNEKASIRNKYQEVLNRCVHLACDYGIEAIIPQYEKESLIKLIQEIKEVKPGSNIQKSLQEAKTACDFCWCCMDDVKWPMGMRNWRSIGHRPYSNYREPVKKEEYYYLFREVVKAYNDLLITIRRENPAFQNKINLFELLKSFHGNIGMTNERILAQSGSFIISGLENLYISREMKSTRSVGYMRMIIKNKGKIFKELSLFNITDATMLPDITHKAKYLLDGIGH